MSFRSSRNLLVVLSLFLSVVLAGGCNIVKTKDRTPTLLATVDASQDQLMAEVNRFASVTSIRAKMYLKFEDNSFAQFGSKEVYRSADGDVLVQRPANIYLKVQVPIIKSDVAEMTSDGTKFRVAVLNAGKCADCRKFIVGTNDADYSRLQQNLDSINGEVSGDIKQNVDAFANLRPQHFTDAMLVRPTDDKHTYAVSTTYLIEEDTTLDKKSPLRRVVRGYYLLDEFGRGEDGRLKIERRFWFDRVGAIRLAKQQIFDKKGEIESDIVYGREGKLTATGEYDRLPLQILVTRPQEKYSMRLTYQSPESVTIGKKYPETVFVLENSRGLPELDLDKKLQETTARKKPAPTPATSTTFQ